MKIYIRSQIVVFFALLFAASAFAQQISFSDYQSGAQVVSVPPGNRFANSPPIPTTTWQRFSRTLSTPEHSFQTTLNIFARNRFGQELKRVAPLYGVDPLLVLGAIIGEHTFNTGVADWAQGVYMGMVSGWVSAFQSNNVNLARLIEQPHFARCQGLGSEYRRWECIQEVWNAHYRGRNGFPQQTMRMAFFNPVRAGHTFGVGQLDPLRALMVADLVSQNGLPRISVDNPTGLYTALLDERQGIHYICANVAMIVLAYREIAKMDISGNVGVVATLYNLGNERLRAGELFRENSRRLGSGLPIKFPEENYYGWFVNTKERELRNWLERN